LTPRFLDHRFEVNALPETESLDHRAGHKGVAAFT
jgi:hypothetical protein